MNNDPAVTQENLSDRVGLSTTLSPALHSLYSMQICNLFIFEYDYGS